MENIISKIEIFSDANITIEPAENTTLITGASGEGKTLLFKLITYTLGNDSKIEAEILKFRARNTVYSIVLGIYYSSDSKLYYSIL